MAQLASVRLARCFGDWAIVLYLHCHPLPCQPRCRPRRSESRRDPEELYDNDMDMLIAEKGKHWGKTCIPRDGVLVR